MQSIKRKIEQLENLRTKSGLTPSEWIELGRSMQGSALIPGRVYPYSEELKRRKDNK